MTAKQTEASAAPATGNIYQRIPAIMRDIEAIPKDRRNQQQGYSFRGIDDVYNLIHPVMAKHGVFMSCVILSDRTEERKSNKGNALIYRVINARYRFTADDGSSIETDVIGEGMDSGDKSANKAMSVGQKYALLQVFMVPTDDPKDPENENHEVEPKAAPVTPAAPNATPAHDDFFDEPAEPDPWAYLDDLKKAKDQLKKLTGADDEYYNVLTMFKAEHADKINVTERPAALKHLREAYVRANRKAAKK
ncbi:MAG: ERF family protein [Candidatus Omnitrophica bacterium]|nr:ERF family protein [Candidatus Omnitrophota bacterium]